MELHGFYWRRNRWTGIITRCWGQAACNTSCRDQRVIGGRRLYHAVCRWGVFYRYYLWPESLKMWTDAEERQRKKPTWEGERERKRMEKKKHELGVLRDEVFENKVQRGRRIGYKARHFSFFYNCKSDTIFVMQHIQKDINDIVLCWIRGYLMQNNSIV